MNRAGDLPVACTGRSCLSAFKLFTIAFAIARCCFRAWPRARAPCLEIAEFRLAGGASWVGGLAAAAADASGSQQRMRVELLRRCAAGLGGRSRRRGHWFRSFPASSRTPLGSHSASQLQFALQPAITLPR